MKRATSGFQKRRGIFEAGILILALVVIIIAIVAVTFSWSDFFEQSYIKIITHMPKFDYNVVDGHEEGNENFDIYLILRNITGIILVIAVMFAGVSFMFEKLNLFPPETGFQILSRSLLYVFFFFFFPPVWDLTATAVETMSIWLLNPEDPLNPASNVRFLLEEVGNPIKAEQAKIEAEFSIDNFFAALNTIGQALNPLNLLQTIFVTAFLAVIKSVAFLIFMFMAFMIGTIREVLTAVVMIGLPMIMVLSLFPFFKRITDKFIDTLLGLMIAPIFSALVIVAGVAYIHSLPVTPDAQDNIVRWFSALAVMVLASFMPALIAPFMGTVLGAVQGIATTSVLAGSTVTGLGAVGAAQGFSQSARGIMSAGREAGLSGPQIAAMAMSPRGIGEMTKGATKGMISSLGAAGRTIGLGPLEKVGREFHQGGGSSGPPQNFVNMVSDNIVKRDLGDIDTSINLASNNPQMSDPIYSAHFMYDVETINNLDPQKKMDYYMNAVRNNLNDANLRYLSKNKPDALNTLMHETGQRFEKNPHGFIAASELGDSSFSKNTKNHRQF